MFDDFGWLRQASEQVAQGVGLLIKITDFLFSRPRVMFWSILGFLIWGAIIGAKDTWLLIAGIFLILWGISIRRAEVKRARGLL